MCTQVDLAINRISLSLSLFQARADTPNSTNQLTASEAVEADLIRPMSPAPMGKGHMPILNLLGLTVSESIRFKQQYRHKGTSNIYVDDMREEIILQ